MKKYLSQHFGILLLSIATVLSTPACAPLIIGGLMAGTIFVVTDRRTSGAQLEDKTIELRSAGRLREALGEGAHINVTSYNGRVLLTGEVPNEQAKNTATHILNTVPDVQQIYNRTKVLPKSSFLSQSNDALLSTKVKVALLDKQSIPANSIKVVTERGVVYLMGLVTQTEAESTIALVRVVPGVEKVVALFELISVKEAQRLDLRTKKPTQ